MIHDRPVRDVREQEVDAVVQLLGTLDGRRRDEALLVAVTFAVAKLDGVAAAERNERAAVQHAAAEVEVLVDDEDTGAEIARADRSRQSRTAATRNDDVGLVVPLRGGALAVRAACVEQHRGAEARGGARLQQVAAAYAFFFGELRLVVPGLVLLRHVELSPRIVNRPA